MKEDDRNTIIYEDDNYESKYGAYALNVNAHLRLWHYKLHQFATS